MKTVKYIWILLLLINLASCQKDKGIYESIEFGVSLDGSNSYIEGELLTFNFSGNADYIVFYSGEAGAIYNDPSGATGVSIKTLVDDVESYSYTYQNAGEYTASFVATSANIYGSSQVVRQVTFTVDEKETPKPDTSVDTTESDDVEYGGGLIQNDTSTEATGSEDVEYGGGLIQKDTSTEATGIDDVEYGDGLYQ
ncbi:MAG: DUF5017 domain-containing protein [Rikenellaceae bacterium]